MGGGDGLTGGVRGRGRTGPGPDCRWRCAPQGLLALGDYMNVQCHACIGGTNVGEDIRKLDYGQHVVAGTPGRVFGERFARSRAPRWGWCPRPASLHRRVTCGGRGSPSSFLAARGLTPERGPADMIRRRSLRTRAIKMLVLDEADEMLNKGACRGGGWRAARLRLCVFAAPSGAVGLRGRGAAGGPAARGADQDRSAGYAVRGVQPLTSVFLRSRSVRPAHQHGSHHPCRHAQLSRVQCWVGAGS